MENKSPDVLDSPGAPYLSGLARTYGYAADYRAIAHPSLPNYIALTSGSTHGVSHDWSPGVPGQPMTYAWTYPRSSVSCPEADRVRSRKACPGTANA